MKSVLDKKFSELTDSDMAKFHRSALHMFYYMIYGVRFKAMANRYFLKHRKRSSWRKRKPVKGTAWLKCMVWNIYKPGRPYGGTTRKRHGRRRVTFTSEDPGLEGIFGTRITYR